MQRRLLFGGHGPISGGMQGEARAVPVSISSASFYLTLDTPIDQISPYVASQRAVLWPVYRASILCKATTGSEKPSLERCRFRRAFERMDALEPFVADSACGNIVYHIATFGIKWQRGLLCGNMV